MTSPNLVGTDHVGVEVKNKVNAHFNDASQHANVEMVFGMSGTATVRQGVERPVVKPFSLTDIEAYAATAPTGSSLTLAIMRNGVSVQTLSIVAGQQTATTTGLNIAFTRGQRIRVDITAFGSTVAGADISLTIGGTYT